MAADGDASASGNTGGVVLKRVVWSGGVASKPRLMRTTEIQGSPEPIEPTEPTEDTVDTVDTEGYQFNDMSILGDTRTKAISRIVIRAWCIIDSIQVYYTSDNVASSNHGGDGGARHEFTLEPGEFIRMIAGRAGSRIEQLTFFTNKRILGPYGGTGGKPFIWDGGEGIPANIAPNMGLLYFSGSCVNYLNQLQATFAEYPPAKNSVKYEGFSEVAAPLSKFTCHLMAPIITLYVGPERTEFHAHEDTLCQIPFFQAALRGQFKEALEKTISMPEDDLSQVSALIQFLYTGSYTHVYKTKGAESQDISDSPAADLTEGLSHLGVYAIASKYGCQGLVDIALKNFEVVLDALDEIDVLRLLKAAYANEIRLPDQKSYTGQDDYDKKLKAWVGVLFKYHRGEMEKTMSENPELSCDLLRLAAGY